jgi:hypothetical protein
MLNAAEIRAIRASRLVYANLIFLYPSDLRCRFGVEMADVFEDLMRAAAARRGAQGIVLLWGSVLWELLTVAVPSRLTSSPLMAGALSFLASSALFLVFFSALN